jgi:hypothetical protein
MDLPSSEPALSQEPPPARSSLPARLANVFAAPGDVFEEIKAAPVSHANWLVPAVILMVVSWIGAYVIFSQGAIQQQIREATEKAIQQSSHMSEQQADQARGIAEKGAVIAAQVTSGLLPVWTGLAIPFWWGLVLWLIGTKIFKADFSYLKAVETTGLATMIIVLDAVVRTLLILLKGNVYASPSLMLLVKDFDPQKTGQALLGLVNIMTFWLLAVRAIGLARLARVSVAKAAAWVFGFWAAWTGLWIGVGLALAALMKALTATSH